MKLSPTCVLKYAMLSFQGCMPCIFVIFVVTSTSMQTRVLHVADFRDLVISLSPCLLLFLCHVFMLFQRDLCLFRAWSVRMFWAYGCSLSIHAFVCIYGVQ